MPGYRGGRHLGQRRDSRATITALLRRATEPLSTPEIIAAVQLSRMATFHQLSLLERDGVIKRIGEGAGRDAHRWYLRTDLEEDVAD
jgi:predicted ArsR family transcriptional regulator